ncbi:FecR family protein [Desulfovibrio sp. OttesenSCG-928-I05]|nr:FecR family protein [Desulfovibrio sp. OttesenSCG-928-I05]
MKRLFSRAAIILVLLVACATGALAEGPAIGHVIKVVPGAFVVRDGQTIALALKDTIQASDVITTDASGRVQIIFTDDSTVSVASSSSFHMRDYAEGEAGASFNGHLGSGMVRVVTGFIVEQNPEAFQLSTPLGTAGIRGTILSLRHEDKHSTIWVENTSKGVDFNGVLLREGFRMDITPDGHKVSPITGKDLETVRQGTQISSNASPTMGGSRVYVGQRGAYMAVFRETDAAAYSLQSDGDYQTIAVIDWEAIMRDHDRLVSIPVAPLLPSLSSYTSDLLSTIPQTGANVALVTGSLNSSTIPSGFAGLFSFQADLSTGVITTGELLGRWDSGLYDYEVTNASGIAAGGNVHIDFSDVLYSSNNAWVSSNTTLDLTGNWNSNGASLNGTYHVGNMDGSTLDQGTASGSSTTRP